MCFLCRHILRRINFSKELISRDGIQQQRKELLKLFWLLGCNEALLCLDGIPGKEEHKIKTLVSKTLKA